LIPQANIKANSNVAIPNFSDGTINGKGYSFNPVPKERFDNAQRPELFKSGAYGPSPANSISGDVQNTFNQVKQALKEEENFLNGVFGATGKKFNGNSSNSMVKIKDVPD